MFSVNSKISYKDNWLYLTIFDKSNDKTSFAQISSRINTKSEILFTGNDFEDELRMTEHVRSTPLIAKDRVRYMGDVVALIAAETNEAADEALKEIISMAMDRKSGARALRSVLENSMLDIMFNLPEYSEDRVSHITITKEFILRGKKPFFKRRKRSA